MLAWALTQRDWLTQTGLRRTVGFALVVQCLAQLLCWLLCRWLQAGTLSGSGAFGALLGARAVAGCVHAFTEQTVTAIFSKPICCS